MSPFTSEQSLDYYHRKRRDKWAEKLANDRLNVVKLKEETMIRYNPSGRLACSTCHEYLLRALTLSHLAPTPSFPQKGLKLYRALRGADFPEVPLLTECMNCNVQRDNWGKINSRSGPL